MALKTSQKARNPKRRKGQDGTGRGMTVFLLAGGGVILLIVLVYFIFPWGSDPKHMDRLQTLEARLQQLERSMARNEMQGRKAAKLEEEFKNYAIKMMDRVDSIEKSITLIRKHLAERPRAGYAQKAVKHPVKKPPAKVLKRPETPTAKSYHTVRPGETLYRISLKYGLTVKELLRINSLGPGAVIRPGQKLLVSKPGK
jgi:hypothetical protein